jgi:hypothetical protein
VKSRFHVATTGVVSVLPTIQELAGSAEGNNSAKCGRMEYAASRQRSALSWGGGFCGMIVSFVKPVAEPSSNT